MQHGWAVIAVAMGYLGLLFAIAAYADRMRPAWMEGWARPYIYSFSIAVYCSSWTFFGSVGQAATQGLDFIGVYTGPIIAFALASPLILKIARLAKAQNITSVADFLAARYGKNQTLAVVVSLAALVGAVPYIALQLKAITAGIAIVLDTGGPTPMLTTSFGGIPFWITAILAVFAILFGTRHIDATEHQPGLALAIATESLIKLVALLSVGIFVVWGMFGGLGPLVKMTEAIGAREQFETVSISKIAAFTVLSFSAIFLLPRQFHVMVVENMGEREIRHAALLVPLYMIAINIFIVPMAVGGLLVFSGRSFPPDMYVLGLPMEASSHAFTVVAFVGGLSAATAMVIVETVALAIMLSNNIAVPVLLRSGRQPPNNMRRTLFFVRRASIAIILLFAYIYYRTASDANLASIGLLSMAAIAQFAPAFFGGLVWKGASGRGAILGILTGLCVWMYTLFLPSIAHDGMLGAQILTDGLFGIHFLRPQALFGLEADPLVHSVVWSLTFNVLAFVAGSLTSTRSPMERLQAATFVGRPSASMAQSFRSWHIPVRVGELQGVVARYLGEERARQAFEEFADNRGTRISLFDEADIHMVRFAEHLLTSVIGPSSARLVLSLSLRRTNVSQKEALKLLDEASMAVKGSYDLLQSAIDHSRHGIVVYDKDLRLVCWNREFIRIFAIPEGTLHMGRPVEEIIRDSAERGLYGSGDVTDIIAERLERTVVSRATSRVPLSHSGRTIEIRSDAMPDGGLVVTFTDITDAVLTEKSLEARVNERTQELTRLNQELARAKAEADSANYSKTRFLAAASHDILQPLNAARLYVASLSERADSGPHRDLAGNIDASLQSVEEIFSILLDISRLDAGAFKPDIGVCSLGDIFRQLDVEFRPLAESNNINLTFVHTDIVVRSDRRLLRRVLQNLVSNAIKYTQNGGVVMGVRRRGAHVRIEVWDTGLGIPEASQKAIFREFQRLDSGARVARGLGLGLSIVERVSRVLDHPLTLRSQLGKGSVFGVEVPIASGPITSATQPTHAAPTSLLSGMRVLCIDNEPAILDGMQQLLSGWQCRVMTAPDLPGALAIIEREGAPDIVICDYHLDGGDGLSTMRQIRARTEGGVPGILLTADRGQAVREGARDQGFEILHKPLRPAALRALLAQIRVKRPAAE